MNKRKRPGKFKGISVICIIFVIFLGLMGVCYGVWTEKLNISTSLTTGNTETSVTIDDRDLAIDISEDGRLVYIDGEIYRDSSRDIDITVKSTGTIPLVFNKMEEATSSEITELDREGKKRHSMFTFSEDDVIDNFNLRISTFGGNESPMGFRSYNDRWTSQGDDGIQAEINALEGEIRELEAEISRLSEVESHDFKYILHFIQGI